MCLGNLSPSWAVCIHFEKQTTLWVRFLFSFLLSFFFFFIFLRTKGTQIQRVELIISLNPLDTIVIGPCKCPPIVFVHFIFISIPTLLCLLLIGEPVVVLLCILLFVYILRKQVLLICLCVVLIYINCIVFQISFFFFFYSMHCFLKFGPSCVLVYLHFIALSTSAVFASLFSQFWGSEFSLILLGWQKLRNWTFPSDRDTESSCATCRRLGVHTLESSAWVYVCARACIR